eukprot:591279-Prorocentrum_minimum.AAC.1
MHTVSFTLPSVPDNIGAHSPCRNSIHTTELQGFRNPTYGRFTDVIRFVSSCVSTGNKGLSLQASNEDPIPENPA